MLSFGQKDTYILIDFIARFFYEMKQTTVTSISSLLLPQYGIKNRTRSWRIAIFQMFGLIGTIGQVG